MTWFGLVTQLEKKLPGFMKLGSHAWKLFMFASSPDAESEVSAPVPVYAILLGIKSICGAREHLKNELKADNGDDFIPSTALTTSLYNRAFQ
jgi:hypothetical protein